MNDQPVYSIGGLLTSFKLAVLAIATVLVVFLPTSMVTNPDGTPNNVPALILAATAAFTVFIGDLLGYILTKDRVTSVANPNLPIDTIVNEHSGAPTGIVRPLEGEPA
jgi:hypothetical protein